MLDIFEREREIIYVGYRNFVRRCYLLNHWNRLLINLNNIIAHISIFVNRHIRKKSIETRK